MPDPRTASIAKRAAKAIAGLAEDREMHVPGRALVNELAAFREWAEPPLCVGDVVDGFGCFVLLVECARAIGFDDGGWDYGVVAAACWWEFGSRV